MVRGRVYQALRVELVAAGAAGRGGQARARQQAAVADVAHGRRRHARRQRRRPHLGRVQQRPVLRQAARV